MAKRQYEKIFDQIISCEPVLGPLINEVRSVEEPSWHELIIWIDNYRELDSLEYKQKIINLYLQQAIVWAYKFSLKYNVDLQDAVSSAYMAVINTVENLLYSYRHTIDKNQIMKLIKKEIINSSNLAISETADGLFIDDTDEDGFEAVNVSAKDDVFELASNGILHDYLEEALASFPEREQQIIRLLYGLGDEGAKTREQVAKMFRLSKSRIGQIESDVLKKLKHRASKNKLGRWNEHESSDDGYKIGYSVPVVASEDEINIENTIDECISIEEELKKAESFDINSDKKEESEKKANTNFKEPCMDFKLTIKSVNTEGKKSKKGPSLRDKRKKFKKLQQLLQDDIEVYRFVFDGKTDRIESIQVGDRLDLERVSTNHIGVYCDQGSLGRIPDMLVATIGPIIDALDITLYAHATKIIPPSTNPKSTMKGKLFIKIEIDEADVNRFGE